MFTATFDKFNVFLLIKSINTLKKNHFICLEIYFYFYSVETLVLHLWKI